MKKAVLFWFFGLALLRPAGAQIPNEVYNTLFPPGNTAFQTAHAAVEALRAAKNQALGVPDHQLLLWLQGSRITGLSAGEVVTEWADASGNNRHARATVPGREPTFRPGAVRGKSAVHFDAQAGSVAGIVGGQLLDAMLPLNGHNSSFTVFLVYQSEVGSPEGTAPAALLGPINNAMDAAQPNIGPAPLLILQHFPPVRLVPEVYGPVTVSMRPYMPNEVALTSLVWDAETAVLMLYRDGEVDGGGPALGKHLVNGQSAPVALTEVPALNLWRFGNDYHLRAPLIADIAEIRIYEGAMGPAAREAVEREIAAEYQIPLRNWRVVFADNFNGPDGADLHAGLAGRQEGIAAPAQYQYRLFSVASYPGVNAARLRGGMLEFTNVTGGVANTGSSSLLSPQVDFRHLEVEESFRVQVDISVLPGANVLGEDPLPAATGQPQNQTPLMNDQHFAAIKIRESEPVQFDINGGEGMTLRLHARGVWTLWNNFQLVGSGTVLNFGDGPAPAAKYCVDIQVTNSMATIFINGKRLSHQGVSEFPITRKGANYITLQNGTPRNTVAPGTRFDNLAVSVPWPSHQDETILRDDFDVPDGGLNASLAQRQEGPAAPAEYPTRAAGGEGSGAIRNGEAELRIVRAGGAEAFFLASPAADSAVFEFQKTLVVQAQIKPPAVPDGWAALKLAGTEPLAEIERGPGIGLLLSASEGLRWFEGDNLIPVSNILPASQYQVEMRIAGDSALLWVNGRPAIFSGGRTVYRFDPPARRYVTMGVKSIGATEAVARFDELRIATSGPTPPRLTIRPLPEGVELTWIDPGQRFLLAYKEDLDAFWDMPYFEVEFDQATGRRKVVSGLPGFYQLVYFP